MRLKELASSSDDHGEREAIAGAAPTIAVVADRIENKHVRVNAEFLLRAEELLTGRGQQLPFAAERNGPDLPHPSQKYSLGYTRTDLTISAIQCSLQLEDLPGWGRGKSSSEGAVPMGR